MRPRTLGSASSIELEFFLFFERILSDQHCPNCFQSDRKPAVENDPNEPLAYPLDGRFMSICDTISGIIFDHLTECRNKLLGIDVSENCDYQRYEREYM